MAPGQCSICDDRATGKHYGTMSCDGCKGFFRRTVRHYRSYVCRFDRSCVIDMDKRNTCRYCRFKKCVEVGMRREAVQIERDRIGSKRVKRRGVLAMDEEEVEEDGCDSLISMEQPPASAAISTLSTSGDSILSELLKAENTAAQRRARSAQETKDHSSKLSSTTSATEAGPCGHNTQHRLATISDLNEAIEHQLLLLVEWTKVLPPLFDLPLEDKVALLRAYSAQHLLFGVARRSLAYRDVLLLSNDARIPRTHSFELHDVNYVITRLLDELVEPMREVSLDDTESACIKALLFFNPSACGLHTSTKTRVKATRLRVLEALEAYVNEKSRSGGDGDRIRFGNILLLLPSLQAIAQLFVEDLRLATLFGMAKFGKLSEELLLAAAKPAAAFLVDGISAGGFLTAVVNGNTGMETVDDAWWVSSLP